MAYLTREITASAILQKSGLPDADWVVNPYAGCAFGCAYCYAAFVGRFSHPDEPWGSYVDIKVNAPQLLREELSMKLRNKRKKDIGKIFLSSVTDPYQAVEGTFKLTRQCLSVLADAGYEGSVGILTKSTLITRDTDILENLKNVTVGVTVTSTGDPIARFLETNAPGNAGRLLTLARLHEKGLKTYAFIGPLLPHFVRDSANLKKLLLAVKETGVSYVYLEHLNLNTGIWKRLLPVVRSKYPEFVSLFELSKDTAYRDKLTETILTIARSIDLPVKHQTVIYHRNRRSWKKLRNGSQD